MRRIIINICLALLIPASLLAQSGGKRSDVYFRNGEKEFKGQRYAYAIPFYKSSMQYSGRYDSLTRLHIAESYWYVRNYDSALVWYKSYEHRYGPLFYTSQRIAELSATLNQYREATVIYQQLLKEVPVHNPLLLTARMKGFSDPSRFLRDSLNYKIRLLNLNTKQQDFSPQYFGGGMVFVSNRYSKKVAEKEFGWDGLPFASIYWVKDTADLYTTDTVAGKSSRRSKISVKANDDYTAQTSNDNDIILVSGTRSEYNGTIHQLDKFSALLNSKYNYGPLCFNKAGDKLYFTRNNLAPDNGRYNLEICVATKEKGEWGNIKVMPFVQKQYDYYHPALNADENRLYFCSNMQGSLGGSDIFYVSLLTDYDMSVALPLDNKINTAGNELFPTFNGDTLYFSSDGHPGLGGLDIYKTYLFKGNWKTPENLGYPVNSRFDDFGIIYNQGKTKGFFSSNRLGTDDIYVFEKNNFRIRLEGPVMNKETLRRLDLVKTVITSNDPEEPMTDSMITDLTGNYTFQVKPDRAYTIRFSRPGFYPDSLKVFDSGTEPLLTMSPMLLRPVETAPPPAAPLPDRDKDSVPDVKDKCPDVKGTVSNFGCPDIQARINELAKMVFFKTASDELSPAALKPLNEVVQYLTEFPNLTLYIEGHTDNRAGAAYNKDLSQRRARSVKNFFVKKGFDAKRFTTAGFGLERPIATNDTEEGRALNRRVAIQATFN